MRPELQEIVDDVSRLLARPVTLEDRSFNLIAFHSHRGAMDDVRMQSILQRKCSGEARTWLEQFGIATADQPVRTPSSAQVGVLARLCLPARCKGVTYGYLWAIDEDGSIDEAALTAAMDLAGRAGMLMAQQARIRADLGFRVRDLLSTDADTVEDAAREIDALGIIRRGTPVVVVELRSPVGARSTAPVSLWTLPRAILAWAEEDHTTLVVPLGEGSDAVREIAERARQLHSDQLDDQGQDQLVAGIGGARPDLAQVRGSWREARLAARVMERVPSLRPVAVWADLGVYRLLACDPESALASAVLDDAVRRLLADPDPDLRDTALAYLAEAGNVQRTATALNVHRQTVYYRLQRIEQVTGLDLSRGEDRLVLHLGLTLAPLVQRPAAVTAPRVWTSVTSH